MTQGGPIAESVRMRARLTVEQGGAVPPVCEMHPPQAVRLGRNRNNTIVLQDQHASRWHAEIFPADGRWFIRDRNTTNGTRLDGQRIQQATLLRNGQEIGIGDTRLRFTVDPAEEKTDELTESAPGILGEEAPDPEPSSDLRRTALQADELTALFHFLDALCVPLRARRLFPEGAPDTEDPEEADQGPREPPFGALHAYKSNGTFGEREVRFCEVLAGCLANTLHGLRARRALEADYSR